ncbi:MAG: hypothetical protein KGJ86_12040 [Chloroflexota bacterium]|nr:hypothetical protein [Chloroflexota bacterium]
MIEQQLHPLESTSRLTLAQLESHLWGAADILRGSIDSADYKHYIFRDSGRCHGLKVPEGGWRRAV